MVILREITVSANGRGIYPIFSAVNYKTEKSTGGTVIPPVITSSWPLIEAVKIIMLEKSSER
jgi:hypothetical protein